MPSIGSLYTALSGLTAQQRQLEVTSHNVANQATPGYRRQRVELAPVAIRSGFGQTATGTRPGGVEILGVSHARDELFAARTVKEGAVLATTDTLASSLTQLEGTFAEPNPQGMATELQALWSSFNDLANSPDSLSARTQLLQQATSLTDNLHAAAATLQSIRTTATDRVTSLATEVNQAAVELAKVNASIAASPGGANDLLDRRDTLAAKLGQLIGATGHVETSGRFDLTVGGRSLVNGDQVYSIVGAAGSLTWAADGRPVTTTSGEAAGLVSVITDVVPRYSTALDQVASTLVSSVNALHVAGYDHNGVTGHQFFDPAGTTAATISLYADVAGLPWNIAAGAPVAPGNTAPGQLDGEQARALARLADSTTGADSSYRSLVGQLAIESRAAQQAASVQKAISQQATADDASVSSVSMDEEMTQLVTAQRAYEASAKVLTAVDEMLGVLIERTGMVGR